MNGLLLKKYPLVLVVWGDAWSNGGRYYSSEDDHEPTEMRSVGFLMKETNTVVVLASDNNEDESYRKLTAIPVVNIIDIIDIEVEL